MPLTVTYRTRFCPRMFPNIPYAFSRTQDCGCIDCRTIRATRWIRRIWTTKVLRREWP